MTSTLSLQGVSVNLVPWNLCNFAEWPLLHLYRWRVSIWCHEICIILLNDLHFVSTGSECQFGSVPWNLCNFAEWPPLHLYRKWVPIWCFLICFVFLTTLQIVCIIVIWALACHPEYFFDPAGFQFVSFCFNITYTSILHHGWFTSFHI